MRTNIVTTLLLSLVVLYSPTATSAQEDMDQSQQFVEVMTQYLQMSQDLVGLAAKPETAVFQAVEAVVEIYEKRGEKAKAIGHLKDILDDTDHQTVRNLLHLKLRELYQSTGRTEQALEQLDKMIAENLKELNG